MERPEWQRHCLVLFVYLGLTLVMTWPVVIRPEWYVLSEHMDISTAFYNLWWFHHALCELHTWPYTNPLINYPYNFSMAMFPLWVPYDIIALPVMEAKGTHGLPLAFNMVTIVSFTLRGYVTFIFIRYLVKKTMPAFLTGLVLAFCPFVFWHITRIHASCLELLVLLAYFFIRTLQEQSWKPAAGLATAACLLLYTSPYYTADMVLFLPLLGVGLAVRKRETVLKKATLIRLAAATALTLLVCSPFIYHLVIEMIKSQVFISQPHSLRVKYSANLLGFISPGWNLQAYSSISQFTPYPDAGLARNHGIGGYEIFVGYVFLAAVIIGCVKHFRKCFIYLVIALVFVVFSLGPSIHAGTATCEIVTFYDIFHSLLPWLRLERTPVRHLGPALVALAVPAGYGFAWLGNKASEKSAYVLYGFLAAAVLLEFNQAPLKLDRFPVPGFVYEIKADPAPGSLLNLPHTPDTTRIAGYYHMHHERALIFRHISRGMDTKGQSKAILRYLVKPRMWLQLSGKERDKALDELVRELDRRDLRYLVVYPKFMEEEDYKGLRELIFELEPAEVIEDNENYFVCRFDRWSVLRLEYSP